MKLTDTELARYRQDGYVVASRVIDAARVDELCGECARVWRNQDISEANPRVQWRRHVSGEKVADRLDWVLDLSPMLQALTEDPGLIQCLRQLLDTPAPEIFKAKVIYKWPGIAGYGLHQDYGYWRGLGESTGDDFVTALVALDIYDIESGTIEVFPGLHQHLLPPPADNPNDMDEGALDRPAGIFVQMKPGDVLFFHSLTPHRSAPNFSERNRTGLYLTYIRAGFGALGRDFYARQTADFLRDT